MSHLPPTNDCRNLFGLVIGLILSNVSFATDAPTVVTFLSNAGASPAAAEDNPPIPPEDLTRQAIAMTVLVSCWR